MRRDELVANVRDVVRQIEEHDHKVIPGAGDLYCLNLTSWIGERGKALLAHIDALEAECKAERAARGAETKRAPAGVILGTITDAERAAWYESASVMAPPGSDVSDPNVRNAVVCRVILRLLASEAESQKALATERECRINNTAELARADTVIGDLRADLKDALDALERMSGESSRPKLTKTDLLDRTKRLRVALGDKQ